jgi:hypothetical protein
MRFRIHASKNAMIIFDIHFSEIIISISMDTYSIEKLGKNALVSKEIKMSLVLLTVPHAVCEAKPSLMHYCDYGALNFAMAISEAGRGVIALVGNVNRRKCDLNRIACADTLYIANVRRAFESGDVSLHLDIHSYPVDYSGWEKYEIVVLIENPGVSNLVEKFAAFLAKRGVSIGIFQGTTNYLIELSASYDVPSWLIEIREDVNPAPIASMIAEWTSRLHYHMW